MAFEAFEISLAVIRAVRPLVARIRLHDADLADQVRRASSSVSLNLAEGSRRHGRDRTHHWRVAAGSADETRAGLLVAEANGYLAMEELPLGLLDRQAAILYRLVHPRRTRP